MVHQNLVIIQYKQYLLITIFKYNIKQGNKHKFFNHKNHYNIKLLILQNQNKYFNHKTHLINNLFNINNYNKHKDIQIKMNLKFLFNKLILHKIHKWFSLILQINNNNYNHIMLQQNSNHYYLKLYKIKLKDLWHNHNRNWFNQILYNIVFYKILALCK